MGCVIWVDLVSSVRFIGIFAGYSCKCVIAIVGATFPVCPHFQYKKSNVC